MTIAVKFGDLTDPKQLSGFIFLDAVTKYDKVFGGRVTEHPVESGVTISDHFRSENPKFRISGVISGVDLSPIPYLVKSLATIQELEGVEASKIKNVNNPPVPITVDNTGAGLRQFLPDTISQFLPTTSVNITGGDGQRQDYKGDVEIFLELIMNGVFYNEDRKRWENRMTLSTLYEMDGSQLGRSYNNCILTNYSVTENVETGEGLFLDLSFERVRFAESGVAQAPAPRKNTPTSRAAAPQQDMGSSNPKTAAGGSSPNNAPARSVPLLFP